MSFTSLSNLSSTPARQDWSRATPGAAPRDVEVDRGGGASVRWSVARSPSSGSAVGTPLGGASYQSFKEQYKAAHGGAKMPFAMKHALRPTPDSIIDQASVERMRQAEGGVSHLHDHNLNPTKNPVINDKAFVPDSKKELGAGQHNAVYTCQFRGRAIADARPDVQTHVVKMAGKLQLPDGNVATMVGHVGISPDKPRTPDRNVAASKLNERLGTTSIPRTSAGVLGGKACLAMSVAPGMPAKDYFRDNPEAVRKSDLQRQMSDIEVNAFLSGNPDPNPTNIMIGEDTSRRLVATMIDNDMAFGSKMTNPDQPPVFDPKGRSYHHTGLPAYMSSETCRAVLDLDIDDCARDLGQHLEPAEVDAFKGRAALAKEHAQFLTEQNRVVADWSTFSNAHGEPVSGGDFFTGTMQMAPVRQGVDQPIPPGRGPMLVPRSLICRDMMVWNRSAFANLPETGKLVFPERVIVPPSGHDPRPDASALPPGGVERADAGVGTGGTNPAPTVSEPFYSFGQSSAHEQISHDTGSTAEGRAEGLYNNEVSTEPEEIHYNTEPLTRGSEEGLYNNVASNVSEEIVYNTEPTSGEPAEGLYNNASPTDPETIVYNTGSDTEVPAEGLYNNRDVSAADGSSDPEEIVYNTDPPEGSYNNALPTDPETIAYNTGSDTDAPAEGLYNNRDAAADRPTSAGPTIGGHRPAANAASDAEEIVYNTDSATTEPAEGLYNNAEPADPETIVYNTASASEIHAQALHNARAVAADRPAASGPTIGGHRSAANGSSDPEEVVYNTAAERPAAPRFTIGGHRRPGPADN